MPERFPRFSLLFADPNAPEERRYSAETLNFIGPLGGENPEKLKQILSRKTSRRDLQFRKEILEDFLQNPSLLTKIEGILRRLEGLEETAKREKMPSPQASWEEAFEILQENTRSLMEHLRFLRLAHDEMAKEAPESGGLFAFAEYLRLHGTSPAVKALTEQVAGYPLLRKESAEFVLHLSLDRYGRGVDGAVAYLGPDEEKYLKKHPVKREDLSLNVPKERAEEWTARGLVNLCDGFCRITAGIRQRFSALAEGMVFYRFALALAEWAHGRGLAWCFATPVNEGGPSGRGIRNFAEFREGVYHPPLTCTAREAEFYEGDRGTEVLKILAQVQIFACAGLPLAAEQVLFCPEQRLCIYSPEGKTTEEEIAALAALYRDTRKGDLLLLDHPLLTVGKAPAAEIMENLLRAFRKKGAALRLATDLTIR